MSDSELREDSLYWDVAIVLTSVTSLDGEIALVTSHPGWSEVIQLGVVTSLDEILPGGSCLDVQVDALQGGPLDVPLDEGHLDAAYLEVGKLLDVAIKLRVSLLTGALPLDGCFAGLASSLLSGAFVQGVAQGAVLDVVQGAVGASSLDGLAFLVVLAFACAFVLASSSACLDALLRTLPCVQGGNSVLGWAWVLLWTSSSVCLVVVASCASASGLEDALDVVAAVAVVVVVVVAD